MYTTYIDTMKKKKKNPNKYEMKTWIDLAKKNRKSTELILTKPFISYGSDRYIPFIGPAEQHKTLTNN